MEKIKILHCGLSGNLGGIESFLLNVTRNIDLKKFEFSFVNLGQSSDIILNSFKEYGCRIYQVPSCYHALAYIKFFQKILANDFNILHLHKNSAANILPVIAARNCKNLKVIIHSHNTKPSVCGLSNLLHYMNRRYLYNRSDVHLACSDVAGKWLYAKRPYEVICNGIDVLKFAFDISARIELRKQMNIPINAVVYGHIGRFTKQKNHVYLIELFKIITKIQNNSYLILVGTGELQKDIREKVCMDGLSKRVFFLGQRRDIPQILSSIDVFLLPSLYEGLPISAIEAQAAGLDVWCADTISSETAITDGYNKFSLLTPVENIGGYIVEKFLKNKNNDSLRYVRNKDVASSKYAIEITVQKLSDIYSQLSRESMFTS